MNISSRKQANRLCSGCCVPSVDREERVIMFPFLIYSSTLLYYPTQLLLSWLEEWPY